jgi:hypothetical protein
VAVVGLMCVCSAVTVRVGKSKGCACESRGAWGAWGSRDDPMHTPKKASWNALGSW